MLHPADGHPADGTPADGQARSVATTPVDLRHPVYDMAFEPTAGLAEPPDGPPRNGTSASVSSAVSASAARQTPKEPPRWDQPDRAASTSAGIPVKMTGALSSDVRGRL